MMWTAIAAVLVLWFIGLILVWGPLVNLLLVAAAVLLVVQLINERESTDRS
jgi:type IV secretory pathway VirB3-like protein